MPWPPLLIDALWEGKPHKLMVQANRNGYFYGLAITCVFLATRNSRLTEKLVDGQVDYFRIGHHSEATARCLNFLTLRRYDVFVAVAQDPLLYSRVILLGVTRQKFHPSVKWRRYSSTR